MSLLFPTGVPEDVAGLAQDLPGVSMCALMREKQGSDDFLCNVFSGISYG